MTLFPEKNARGLRSKNSDSKTEDEELNNIAGILVEAYLEQKKRNAIQSTQKGSDILQSFNKRPSRRRKQLDYPRKDVPRLLPEEWI